MQIPVYIDGRRAGTLTVTRRGPWTELEARLPKSDRLLRLTLRGEREFYLGVPVPEGEGLRLFRRLTAAEASLLPRKPAYASDGSRPAPEPAPEPEAPRRVLWLGGKPHFF